MKLSEVNPAFASPLTYPSSVTVSMDSPGLYKAYVFGSKEPAGTMEVSDGVVLSLTIDAGDRSAVSSALISAACDDADSQSRVLVVWEESLDRMSWQDLFALYGFMKTVPGFMERRPGAVRPPSAVVR